MLIPNHWTFRDAGVAEGFDQHVREQLPWYDLATQLVAHLVRHYLPDGGLMYDVGASTGNVGRAVEDTLRARGARLVGIEASPEMAQRYAAPGELHIGDATDYDYERFDVCVAFLVCMFMPVGRRSRWLERMVKLCRPGGAIILFDKAEPEGGYLGAAMMRLALAGKLAAGADPSDIIAKELSLAGVQRPLHPRELPACATEVFRFGDFRGWVLAPGECEA